MKRFLSVLAALLLCLSAARAEERSLRPQGSALLTDERTILVSLYLTDVGEPWTVAEKAYTRNALALATEYITRVGRDAGVSFELVCEGDGLCRELSYPEVLADLERDDDRFYDVIADALEALPLEALRMEYRATSVAFLLFLNAEGSSFAMPYYSDGPASGYNEYCLIYLYDVYTPGSYESIPAYAHELLHLFGAVDLYEPNEIDGVTEAAVAYVEEHEPAELMYETYEPDGSVSTTGITQTLSELTLYMIGLSKDCALLELFPTLRRDTPAAFAQVDCLTGESDADAPLRFDWSTLPDAPLPFDWSNLPK